MDLPFSRSWVTAGSLLLKDEAAVDVACADPYNP
jgi:hypothetical protein